MPKVSIILTSYNHADYIGKSIESILNQTFNDFELYIVDDCSTDTSWEVIKKYKDERIIAIKHKKNEGGVIKRPLINKLKGEYFAIAHCDDKWLPDKLEKQVEFLEKNQEYAACFTDVLLIDDSDNEFKDRNHPYYNLFTQKNRTRIEWLHQFFYHGNVLCHPSVLLRLDKQKEYDMYACGLSSLPDMYRWIKLCLHDNIYVLNEKLTCFRIRKNELNTSGDKLENKIRYNFESYVILDLYKENLLKKENDFFTVFKEANKYKKSKENDLEFIFAKMLIDMENNKPYQLYGLNLMYHILQDNNREKEIEEKYNYNGKALVKDSSRIDIFGYVTEENTMQSTLFFNYGEDFTSENSISKKIYITKTGTFYTTFNITKEKFLNKQVIKMRFDPSEDRYICCKNMEFKLNDKIINYIPLNYDSEDEWISFNTSDPQFILEEKIEKESILSISGKVKKRNLIDINNKINISKVSEEPAILEEPSKGIVEKIKNILFHKKQDKEKVK